jgi:hypothetical protein
MKLLICNRWIINIKDDKVLGRHSDELPMFENITQKRLLELAKFTWCHYMVVLKVKSLVHVKFFVDFFGGIGRLSLIVNKVMRPSRHVIIDMNVDQYNHLVGMFPHSDVLCGNSFDVSGDYGGADFVSWDENSFTLHKLIKNVNHTKDAIGRLLKSKPMYVQLTDVTASRFHLLKMQFSTESGYDIASIEDYYGALSAVVHDLFGYSVIYVAKYNKLASVLLARQECDEMELVNATDYPQADTFMRII